MTAAPLPGSQEFARMLQTMLPGLAWTPAMLDRVGRAQAAAAAKTLRAYNAPLEHAMRRQREFAEQLTTAAQQLAALAQRIDELAKAHAQINKGLETAVAPYLRYVESLEAYGSGGR